MRPHVDGDADEIYVTYDGQSGYPLQEGDIVRVRKSERTLRLVKAPARSYFELLREKLKWGERGGREYEAHVDALEGASDDVRHRLHGRGLLSRLLRLAAAQHAGAVDARRLYIFENGYIRGLDPKLFGLAREEVKEPDFVNVRT